MKASVVDLRYKMNDVLKALDRNETVTLLYRGKVKGVLTPAHVQKDLKMTDHPFFGMYTQTDPRTVSEVMDELRGDRYRDL